MIRQVKYEIIFEKEEKVNWNWGSVFHGLIMDRVTFEVATKLHEDRINPFSQYCYFDRNDNKSYFVINYLDNFSYEAINSNLENKNHFLKHKEKEIFLKPIHYIETDYTELINKNFSKEKANNFFNIKTVVPICFKERGIYSPMPDSQRVFSSIIRKWDTFSSESKFYDEEVFRVLCERVAISNFNIQTKKFYLEKVAINGFVGDISYKLNCANEIKIICNILEEYSQYCGIGIKTGVGMGGVAYGKYI